MFSEINNTTDAIRVNTSLINSIKYNKCYILTIESYMNEALIYTINNKMLIKQVKPVQLKEKGLHKRGLNLSLTLLNEYIKLVEITKEELEEKLFLCNLDN